MGEESAWPPEQVLAFLAIVLAILTAVAAALHAPAVPFVSHKSAGLRRAVAQIRAGEHT